jgi:hypothetical protein
MKMKIDQGVANIVDAAEKKKCIKIKRMVNRGKRFENGKVHFVD